MLSHVGITTRNRDHANHAQNRFVCPAAARSGPGPSPTAPTCPARGSTADTPAAARPGSSPSPEPPPGGPCGPTRRTRAPASLSNTTSRADLAIANARPTPRSWPGTGRSTSGAPPPRPGTGNCARVALGDPMLRRCDANTPPARPRSRKLPRQIECFQNLHDLLVRLHSLLLVGRSGQRPTSRTGRSTHRADPQQATDINEGRTTGRQRAVLLATPGSYMAASGQDLMAADSFDALIWPQLGRGVRGVHQEALGATGPWGACPRGRRWSCTSRSARRTSARGCRSASWRDGSRCIAGCAPGVGVGGATGAEAAGAAGAGVGSVEADDRRVVGGGPDGAAQAASHGAAGVAAPGRGARRGGGGVDGAPLCGRGPPADRGAAGRGDGPAAPPVGRGGRGRLRYRSASIWPGCSSRCRCSSCGCRRRVAATRGRI